MDVTAEYLELRRNVGAVRFRADVIRATGPQTIGFLQGQLSQDIERLAVGESARSLLLEPQGKLDAWLRVTRVEEESVLIDVESGFGAAALARLQRFKMRTKCELELFQGWDWLAVRGGDKTAVDAAADAASGASGAQVVARVDWPGLYGFDLVGPAIAVPDTIAICGEQAYEAVRIEAGVPRMGAEIVPGLIAEEAGIVSESVSFTKGCYTGQELIARIDSRGANVVRRLRGILVETNVLPPVGATVVDVSGKEVGSLTSVAESLDLRAPVALAYVHRSIEPPSQVRLVWVGGEAPARIEVLPLLPLIG